MIDITWHTEQRRLGDLVEWDKNPRRLSKHDAEHIKKSLAKFGVADPLIINIDNTLIGGHQRKRILGDADMLVDVRVPSRLLTPEEAEELAIRLNKNNGEWDWDKLVANFDKDHLIDYGFTDDELHGLKFSRAGTRC
jgi:site-specific DNA-methyltransferase (adenine-specific)